VDRLSGGERQRVGLARALASPVCFWWTSRCQRWTQPAQQAESLTQTARQRGATLTTTLHHVEMALQPHIGLRDGALAFIYLLVGSLAGGRNSTSTWTG
jgi:phosphonate transport system ATP-binding protein